MGDDVISRMDVAYVFSLDGGTNWIRWTARHDDLAGALFHKYGKLDCSIIGRILEDPEVAEALRIGALDRLSPNLESGT